MKIDADKTYKLQEAAEFLRLNPRTLYRLVKAGSFPAFKVGRSWRIYGRNLLNLKEGTVIRQGKTHG